MGGGWGFLGASQPNFVDEKRCESLLFFCRHKLEIAL